MEHSNEDPPFACRGQPFERLLPFTLQVRLATGALLARPHRCHSFSLRPERSDRRQLERVDTRPGFNSPEVFACAALEGERCFSWCRCRLYSKFIAAQAAIPKVPRMSRPQRCRSPQPRLVQFP